MGAQIVKLINEDSENYRMGFDDVELGENQDSSSNSSWDSDSSSDSDDDEVVNSEDETGTSEYRMELVYPDPYIVEKRFVAGSSDWYYDVVKRR
uniref:Uncharacterized protein n=1 Tax=Caenorhabditis tropicalis TaxID=1561998 RepID=A0A1I7TW41_9PELO